MANDKRQFYCLPRRAIGDRDLSALDHRVLGAIAIHDGMSAAKGTGAGCVAAYKTLIEMIGCDYTSLSKSIGRLLRGGYLIREPQLLDKRKFTLRIIYEAPGKPASIGSDSWRNGQQDDCEIVGETANERHGIVGDLTNDIPEIVGRENFEARSNLPKTAEHYIPLKGEIDSVETEEIDSAKLRAADAPRMAKHAEVRFRDGEPLHETLAKFERQWSRDWTVFQSCLPAWSQWLSDRHEELIDADNERDRMAAHRAERLAGLVDDWIGYVAWEQSADQEVRT